jgi:ketosteroid isomerase-like protein
MRLFRSKKSFWERHKFKLLLSLGLTLGVLGWTVLERIEQLELIRLAKLQSSAESPKLVEMAVTPSLATDVPVAKELLEAPQPAAPTGLVTAQNPSVEPSQVSDALECWSRAWASQDVSTYLAMYGRQFVPPEGKTRAQWELDRRQRILGKKKIQHSMNKLEVSVDGQKAITTFEQVYVADRIQMNQRKVIAWQRNEGGWQIVSETVAP